MASYRQLRAMTRDLARSMDADTWHAIQQRDAEALREIRDRARLRRLDEQSEITHD